MHNIITYLNQHKIDYAILSGKYDKGSIHTEVKEFKSDLDIVLACDRKSFIKHLLQHEAYQQVEENTFLDIENKINIDFYFKTVNVGYYHYLNIDKQSFVQKEVSETEYILYQILDPLLKFSRFHNRHQFRLKAYFKNDISTEIRNSLRNIVGKKLANQLLDKISKDDFNFNKSFIRRCKCSMLFINGNFVKMLKARIFS